MNLSPYINSWFQVGFLTLCAVFSLIVPVVIGLRLWTRDILRSRLLWGDILIILSSVCTIPVLRYTITIDTHIYIYIRKKKEKQSNFMAVDPHQRMATNHYLYVAFALLSRFQFSLSPCLADITISKQ